MVVQSLLYASLACSLFSALAAVLGKQWLSHYQGVGEQGSDESRGLERQRKFDALRTWHLQAILEAVPVLLQASLLLFAAGLSAYIWVQQRTVATVLIVINGTGALFYIFVVSMSMLYEDCPFQSPFSTLLRRTARYLTPHAAISKRRSNQQLITITRPPTRSPREGQQWLPASAVERSLPRSHHSVSLTTDTTKTEIGDVAGSLPGGLRISDAVGWILDASMDLQARANICAIVCMIPWSRGAIQRLPVRVLDGLLDDIQGCFALRDQILQLIDIYREAAKHFISAFLFLFWEKSAESYTETREWVYGMKLVSLRNLPYPTRRTLLETNDLDLLVYLFQQTMDYLRRDGEGPNPLAPVNSARSNDGTGVELLCARTTLYLAQQITRTASGSRLWTTETLRIHQHRILDTCRMMLQSTELESSQLMYFLATFMAVTTVRHTGRLRDRDSELG